MSLLDRLERKERDHKLCKGCGAKFYRNPKHDRKQWASAEFCSAKCSNLARATHGQRHTRLYRVWAGIKTRCLNANDPLFAHYGARGITIAPEWKDDFAAFSAHMNPDPGADFDVGRIDNDRGYEPGNVRWETRSQNMRNKRDTRWIEHQGRRVSLVQLCEELNIPYKRTWARLAKGWAVERALKP